MRQPVVKSSLSLWPESKDLRLFLRPDLNTGFGERRLLFLCLAGSEQPEVNKSEFSSSSFLSRRAPCSSSSGRRWQSCCLSSWSPSRRPPPHQRRWGISWCHPDLPCPPWPCEAPANLWKQSKVVRNFYLLGGIHRVNCHGAGPVCLSTWGSRFTSVCFFLVLSSRVRLDRLMVPPLNIFYFPLQIGSKQIEYWKI